MYLQSLLINASLLYKIINSVFFMNGQKWSHAYVKKMVHLKLINLLITHTNNTMSRRHTV